MNNKKTILMLLVIGLLMVFSAYAILDADVGTINITINYPGNLTYNGSGSGADAMLTLNATVRWTAPTNITNVTFIFVSGSTYTRFYNNTINGSRTTTTSGDFTVNISASQLTENQFTVIVEALNDSETTRTDSQINSSSFTFTIDRTNPSAIISNPLVGSTVVPNNNIVTFEYTPTETNLGNCSLHLNNINTKSSTSGTTSPNITTGAINRFTQNFGADNTSVRVAVQCIDLSGRVGTSNNFTFGVLTGALSPAQRQALISGGGSFSEQTIQQPTVGKPYAIGIVPENSNMSSTHLQQYGWIYVIGIIVVIGVVIRKRFK